MARRGDRTPENYLDCVPRRAVEHETDGDGRTVLLRPKFIKGPLARWLQPRIERKHFRVRLDEVGAATWEAIDGRRTVGEIAEILKDRFGDRVEPCYERCSMFVRSLDRGAMITLERPGPSGGA